ncbi:MAG: D-2-hydroxyacid dehydrogenase [Tissierellaceae bacterium]|nr:D-2-hydroxyacid dehydrogenase [Tissierellaceae bacterium]
MKIVVLDGFILNPGDLTWKGFEELGQTVVYDRTSYDPNDIDLIIERSKDADAILINKTPITREILNSLPNLKYIGVLATGYNVVDIEAAKEKGIVVTNIPTYGTEAVTQMVFALLFELTNHVAEHNKAVKEGQWSEKPDWCFWNKPLMEISGKTIGIIGYGRIGQRVGQVAQAFGMKVLANANRPRRELENENLKYVELEELYKECDIISLHCPLTETTKGMINKDSINMMKDGVIIINTGRGPLIIEEDLAEALSSGKVKGAGLDVVNVEPIQLDNPLLKQDNCIITPHIAWAPRETRSRLMDIAVDNLKGFINSKPINIV